MESFERIIQNIQSGIRKIDLSKLSLSRSKLEDLYEAICHSNFQGEIIWGILPNRSKKLLNKLESQIANLQVKSVYASDFTHILLSLHAYRSHSENMTLFEDKSAYMTQLRDWSVLEVCDHPESSYYGIIYLNKKYNQLILAHRGTQIEGGTLYEQLKGLLLNQDSDLQTDLQAVFGKEAVEQQLQAYYLTQKAVKYAKEHGHSLSITGHSLGAWLSEMSGYYCHRDFNYNQVKIVNFDSPGSAIHMQQFEHNIQNSETELELKNLDITTYLSVPNIVNSCNQHIGKVYQLFPQIWGASQISNSRLKWIYDLPVLGTQIRNNQYILDSIMSLTGHSLEKLVDCFDINSHKPLRYMKVLHWPVIKYNVTKNSSTGLVDFISNNIPNRFLSNCFRGLAGRLVNRYGTKNLLLSGVNIISHFLQGEIDLSQFTGYYQIKNGSKPSEHNIKSKNFALLFKNHYHVIAATPYEEVINTLNKGSIDWYLSRLAKLSQKKILRYNKKTIAWQLIQIKNLYRITIKNGKKYVESRNEDFTIDEIKTRLQYLLHCCEVFVSDEQMAA